MHWNKWTKKVDTFTIQGCWCRKNIYIFGNVAFYTFKCYKKKKKNKETLYFIKWFFLVVVKKQKTKRDFLSFFFIFKYWNKSKEKKVPYFPSWSFSQVSCKISSSLRIQVNACHSVAQYVKEDVRGDTWVDGLN